MSSVFGRVFLHPEPGTVHLNLDAPMLDPATGEQVVQVTLSDMDAAILLQIPAQP